MDSNTQNLALLGTASSGTILMTLYAIYKAIVGKQCKLKIGNTDLELGLQVSDMVQNPLQVGNTSNRS